MQIHFPDHIQRRIPAGHTVQRHTGTVEHTRTDNYNGQRNFIFHPIRGEEAECLRFQGSAVGVTDLPIEQVSGHNVWLFSFTGPEGKIGHFLCWSRSTGQWVTLHDENTMVHLFSVPKGSVSVGKKLAFLGIAAVAGVKVADAYGKNVIQGITLNGPQAHQLILDIRAHLVATMEEPNSAQGGRL